ncbi:MAG: hypothetical protein ACREDD_12910, partial [Methylocella sp.]
MAAVLQKLRVLRADARGLAAVEFAFTGLMLIPTAREPDSWGDSQTAANVTRCSPSLIRGAGSMSAIEI